MRSTGWVMISVAALTIAACSPKASAPPAAPAAPAPSAPPAPAASAPAPESPSAAPVTPETAASPAPAAAPMPPPPPPFHFSPGDYPAKERRITALINNALSRDGSGETQYRSDQARDERRRCSTKACVDHSYAAEEARLRKWEGSGDVK